MQFHGQILGGIVFSLLICALLFLMTSFQSLSFCPGHHEVSKRFNLTHMASMVFFLHSEYEIGDVSSTLALNLPLQFLLYMQVAY